MDGRLEASQGARMDSFRREDRIPEIEGVVTDFRIPRIKGVGFVATRLITCLSSSTKILATSLKHPRRPCATIGWK